MNVFRPILWALRFAISSAGLQIAGLVLLTVAAGLVWGAVGAVTAAGAGSLLVGVALERAE